MNLKELETFKKRLEELEVKRNITIEELKELKDNKFVISMKDVAEIRNEETNEIESYLIVIELLDSTTYEVYCTQFFKKKTKTLKRI